MFDENFTCFKEIFAFFWLISLFKKKLWIILPTIKYGKREPDNDIIGKVIITWSKDL